ncbi:ShlB/FhaC/HecB family hemolysin secretion/activation protein [Dactylococcopsis salina]|uniref:Hemolysin activation/secretion protein n=1 Tax=Dactylococcopsis salina (strain PCC 8305) TaxID=13035 RepID=K9YVB7_DACS8|nr:ShlB/FhaC/HecB family hemolysin secretion/activation protein [Dactylococcopsis salina]AFZ50866.1 hemolysin activation/secretion protein [Dactylococcopsis salina PCC 8305]
MNQHHSNPNDLTTNAERDIVEPLTRQGKNKRQDNLQFFSIHLPIVLYVLSHLFVTTPVFAQTRPQPVLPPREREPPPESTPLPPTDDLLPEQEAPSEEPQPPNLDIPETITVEAFEVVGNTVFTSTELTKVLAPFTNRPLSFTELLEAQRTLTNLYIQEGYITSGAYIPSQTFRDGVVRIQVVEGAIETIVIEGLNRLNESYIRSRIQRGTDTPLNQQALLEALQLLQLNPLIANLTAQLSAGSRPGFSRLVVNATEAPAFSTELTLDNQRSPVVGTDRRLIEVTHNNLLGFGDRANIRYFNTDGSNSLDDLSYTVPINAKNGTLNFRYRRTENDIIEDPFDTLDIESDYRQYVLTYRQPVIRTPREELSFGLTIDRQESDSSLLDELEGETRLFALRFFQEYTNRNAQEVLAARSQFSFGLEGSQVNLNGEALESEFFAWRGQAQYVRRLTPDTTFLLRSELQLADRTLLSLEEFSLGGALTVRGYRQDLLLGDNGFLASAEIRTPILRIPEWDATVRLTPFFDFGTVWNRGEEEVTPRDSLSSLGLGLELLIGENFIAELDWGIPLNDVDIEEDSLQENGLHFSINYQLF